VNLFKYNRTPVMQIPKLIVTTLAMALFSATALVAAAEPGCTAMTPATNAGGDIMAIDTGGSATENLAWLEAYNVVWTSQSTASRESMPVGGGDIGLNVWVENGDLLFYIDRSGNIDENDQQLKSGRVRVRFDRSPFSKTPVISASGEDDGHAPSLAFDGQLGEKNKW